MSLVLRPYAHPAPLWQALSDASREANTLVVCSSRTAQAQLLARVGTTFEHEVIVLDELWGLVAALAGAEPPAAAGAAARHLAILTLLGEPEAAPLATLAHQPGAITELDVWLERIDARADRDYVAHTRVEAAVGWLRTELTARSRRGRAAMHSHVARYANQVRLPAVDQVVVGPLVPDTPYVAGLLAGLAAHHQVSVLIPGPDASLIDLPALRTAERAPTQGQRAPVRAIHGADRDGLALALLERWRDQGARVALVCDDPAATLARLEPRAVQGRVPLRARVRVRAADTPLGRWMRALARGERPATPFAAPPGTPRTLTDLLACGQHAARTEGVDGRAWAWLAALEALVSADDAAAWHAVPPAWALDLVETSAHEVGPLDGIPVVRPTELIGTDAQRAVWVSAPEAQLRSRPPFASPQLLALRPDLADPADDVRTLAAACGVHDELVVVAAVEDTPLIATLGIARTEARRRHATLERLADRAERDLLPGALGGTDTLSVTDLENYLRCPYGWAVGRLTRGAFAQTERARRGSAAHAALASLFAGRATRDEVAVRTALATADWEEDPALIAQLELICARYDGSSWGAERHECELSVSADWEGTLIRGRIDRVDTTPHGLLVIDYKLSHAPTSEDPTELQPFLYPQMLAEARDAEVAGSMYLSLRHGQHRAYLMGELPLPATGITRHDWAHKAARAAERAQEAISGIHAGHITHVGPTCRVEWCPHHLVSPTLAHAAARAPEGLV